MPVERFGETVAGLLAEAQGLGHARRDLGATEQGAQVAALYKFAVMSVDVEGRSAKAAIATAWRFAGGVVPPGAGQRVLTVDLALTNAPRQAIRGVFRWNGSRIPCPGGYLDDVDDLAFDVQP